MKKNAFIIAALLILAVRLSAQVEPTAGNWNTWFIPSGKAYRLLPPPTNNKEELKQILAQQQKIDAATLQQIEYWNAGGPSYRWQHIMADAWMDDALGNGILANMLLSVTTYDAMVAAWDTKYAFNRPRPFTTNSKIKSLAIKPDSPSYPCEHAVAAGVAVTIIGHFFPALADSMNQLATQSMASRVAAGVAYPSDTKAGFELGKKIAEKEIEHTKGFLNNQPWDGKKPDQPGLWNGGFAMLPYAGSSKTVVLEKGNQFRPGPPPDFSKDMAELKNFKQTTSSRYNALYFNGQSVWEDLLDKKIFEYNLHLNPPRATRMYALAAIGIYDGFVSAWDAKYTYWGIRPEQYDTTYHGLLGAPPFPGYPSGHAAISGVMCGIYSYLFPAEKAFFEQKAKDGAESRFHAGIHFRTDNDVALVMGKNVAAAIVQKAKRDGADNGLLLGKKEGGALKKK